MKPDQAVPAENESGEGVSLVSLYKTVLRIIDRLDGGVAPSAKAEYSDDQLRQIDERQLDDLADPASEESTRRAETHCTRIHV